MSAAVALTVTERADVQADLDLTRQIRTQYRHRLHAMRQDGTATVAWTGKLQYQIERCSEHIARYERMLADE